MLNPKVRICAVCLVAVILLSSLVSCADVTDDGAPDTQGTAAEASESATEFIDPASTLDLPELDFNNSTFRVMYIDAENLFTAFDVEGYNGEQINDAIYERDRTLEKLFNVRFESMAATYDQTVATMEKQVTTGAGDSESFDLIMEICRNAYSLTLSGMLCNYNSLSYIDTSKDYYFASVNRQFSIGGYTFFAYGADSLNVLAQANCLMFNKGIAENRGFGNLYELVQNKEWTYEKMFDMIALAADDVDGDGKFSGKTDVMGIVGRIDYSIPALWVSAGERLIDKDEDDMPVYSALGNNRMTEVLQYGLEKASAEYCNIFSGTNLTDTFFDGYSFMLAGGVNHLQTLKSMTQDYGVLPWPMYDKQQDTYYTRLIDGWINCVPANCADTDRTSAIMQALAYYSYGTVYDAYYNQGIMTKFIRDPESVTMLKQILSALTVDLGDTVWYGPMRSALTAALGSRGSQTKVASTLKSQERIAGTQIKNVTKFLQKKANKS